MYDNVDDILVVKRHWTVELDDLDAGSAVGTSTAAVDHYLVTIYKLGNAGTETQVFQSGEIDYFPQTLTFGDTNNPTALEVEVEDGGYYRVVITGHDSGGSLEEFVDEIYVYCRPDVIETQGALVTTSGGPVATAIDQLTLDKLLHVLGSNVLHGEFDYSNGYAGRRTSYGFDSLTPSEAAAILAESDDPDVTAASFKYITILTTEDNGNELASLEQEQSL